MKKLYALIGIVMISGMVTAQSTRLILAEEFTQASCGPCAAQNPAFNTLLAANTTKVVGLKYQTNWPGVDPMNTQTQTWVGPRVTYYAVNGVPHALLDGVAQTGGSYTGAPANWTQAKIDNRYAVMSPFTITVSHSFDAAYANTDITVDVTCSQATTGNLYLQVALVEKEIDFCNAPGTNGETEFYGVMRKMLPNAGGTAIANSWTVGQTQTFTFNSAVPTYVYDQKQLAVVVFIQNNTSKEVLQAGISEPLPIALDASLKDCNAPTASITCGSAFDPNITVYNEGSSTITTLDLTYNVTGGTPQTFTWNGSLAPGASTVVTLPSIPIASFPSTFTSSITSVNGGVDVVAGNNNYSLTISQIPATVVPAPMVQDFVPTTFPPVNWTKINGGGAATWTRIAAGATAANGSAKMDFYNSAAGDVDILYTPKVDLTTLVNPVLTFKLAKQSFTGYVDQLDVVASTDCGATWTTVYSKTDPALTTAGSNQNAFTPTSGSSQWRLEVASLSAIANQPEVLFGFNAISGYGNNMYIDDINVQSTTGIGENANTTTISVFPSITSGDVYVNMGTVKTTDAVVSVFDATGKLVETFNASKDASDNIHINLTSRQDGLYLIQVEAAGQKIVKKVMLEN